jgi:hypothetical protein
MSELRSKLREPGEIRAANLYNILRGTILWTVVLLGIGMIGGFWISVTSQAALGAAALIGIAIGLDAGIITAAWLFMSVAMDHSYLVIRVATHLVCMVLSGIYIAEQAAYLGNTCDNPIYLAQNPSDNQVCSNYQALIIAGIVYAGICFVMFLAGIIIDGMLAWIPPQIRKRAADVISEGRPMYG